MPLSPSIHHGRLGVVTFVLQVLTLLVLVATLVLQVLLAGRLFDLEARVAAREQGAASGMRGAR